MSSTTTTHPTNPSTAFVTPSMMTLIAHRRTHPVSAYCSQCWLHVYSLVLLVLYCLYCLLLLMGLSSVLGLLI